ncbi:hypothetical protein RHMOL_Rhmol07G0141600 [Rhododendron molle]|uniref:Uncharacterized protein n=1 Tax=Rhododendron molle TaxID=49168 RepID=A0ACC0N0D1_RHOML|nr:hypothetical protein RHMOL_Rhmol07G0141600 [Rhododendron molle]
MFAPIMGQTQSESRDMDSAVNGFIMLLLSICDDPQDEDLATQPKDLMTDTGMGQVEWDSDAEWIFSRNRYQETNKGRKKDHQDLRFIDLWKNNDPSFVSERNRWMKLTVCLVYVAQSANKSSVFSGGDTKLQSVLREILSYLKIPTWSCIQFLKDIEAVHRAFLCSVASLKHRGAKVTWDIVSESKDARGGTQLFRKTCR